MELKQLQEESDIDKAIKKLASIADYTQVTEDMRKTAGFMLEAKYRDTQTILISNLQERLRESMLKEREAFKLGQLSGIEKAKGCVPEEMEALSYESEKGFNICREETLTNIKELKESL